MATGNCELLLDVDGWLTSGDTLNQRIRCIKYVTKTRRYVIVVGKKR